MTFITLLDEGDEVLVPEPYYTNYSTFALMAGGVVKPIMVLVYIIANLIVDLLYAVLDPRIEDAS